MFSRLYKKVIMPKVEHSKNSLAEKILSLFVKLPRLFSLSEWSARLLPYHRIKGAATKPGLVMVQIDGLSLAQLE